MRDLAEFLEPAHAHVHVLSDDIYEFIIYDAVFQTFAAIAPEMKDRILTINGLSKAYCMTGWRVGYAAGDSAIIKAMNKIQSQSTTSTSTLSQWASVAALNGDHGFMATHVKTFKQRRDLVVDMMNAIAGISCYKPEGAFYVYPTIQGLIGKKTPTGQTIKTDEDFVSFLLENQGVACVHGEAFGLSPYFRISYATDTETLETACKRIQAACALLT